MSFNVNTTPQAVSPVYNPIIYRTISDIYTANGFKYLFQVYKDSDIIATIKVLPDASGVGLADISRILKNFVSLSPQPAVTLPAVSGSTIRYKVGMGVEVSGGLITAVTNQATVVTLTIQNETTNALDTKQLSNLILPGLTLSHAAPYYIKYSASTYKLYSDALLTTPVTATGTFSPNGYIQTIDNAIATSQAIITTSTERLAINTALKYDDFLNWSDAAIYIFNDSTNKFLTAATTKNIATDEYETLTFLQDNGAANVSYIKISAYNASNTLISSFNLTNSNNISFSGSVYTNPQNFKLEVGVGYMNLHDYNPSNATTDPTCTYYTVQAFDATNAAISEIFTYTIFDRCNKYEPIRLMWLNQLGGYDYYTFIKLDESLKIQSNTFKKTLNYNYTTKDRGNTVYFGQADQSYTVATDFVDTTTSDFLSSLFLSADVYILNGSVLTPVVSLSTEYSYKIKGKDKLKQYTIDILVAHKTPFNI